MSRHYIKPDSPQVSILLVREQDHDQTNGLLQSIFRDSYPHKEVIVVNLGASEKEVTDLYTYFPSIVQVNLKKETEKELALSEGLKIAKGDFLLFLNSVQEVNDDFVQGLVLAAKKSSRIAIVSPQVRIYSQKEIVIFRGSGAPKNIRSYLDYSSYHASLKGEADQPVFAQFACNDAFLVSMEFLHKLEETQKGLFFFLDELDMAETVHENRYKIYYEPRSVAYLNYLEEKSRDSQSIYLKTRNRLASIRKHRNGWVLVGVLLLFSFSYIPKHTFQHLLHLRLDHVAAFYRGVIWNVFHSVKSGGLLSKFRWK